MMAQTSKARRTVTTTERLQVTVEEAAQMLSYSKRTVYDLLQRRELPSTGRGRLRRIPVAALHAYVDRLSHED
jgi:excisionase family DNA binding protein